MAAVRSPSLLRFVLGQTQRHWTWLKWVLALGILAFLYHQNVHRNREDLQRYLAKGLAWPDLAIAFALCAGSTCVGFVRWYLLVWAQGFDFRLRDAFRLGFVGFLCNYISPGAVGGDLVKAALIAREQPGRRAVAVATVLLDRILGMLALVLTGAVLSFAAPSRIPQLQVIDRLFFGGSIAGLLGLAVMLHPAVPRLGLVRKMVGLPFGGRIFGEILNGIVLYQQRRLVVALAVVLSIVCHVGVLTGYWFCTLGMRMEPFSPPVRVHMRLVASAEIGSAFVPSPGGTGVLEGAVSVLFGLADPVPDALPEDLGKNLPPEWREALSAFRSLPTGTEQVLPEGGEAARKRLTEVTERALSGIDAEARLFFRGEMGDVSAAEARSTYLVGRRKNAETAGFLTAFAFRLMTIVLAAFGAVYYFGARREIRAALDVQPPSAAASDRSATSA